MQIALSHRARASVIQASRRPPSCPSLHTEPSRRPNEPDPPPSAPPTPSPPPVPPPSAASTRNLALMHLHFATYIGCLASLMEKSASIKASFILFIMNL